MDTLPIDLYEIICNNIIKDNPPLLSYRLKYVNKNFFKIIEKYNNGVCLYLDDIYDNKKKIYKNGDINLWKWLNNNNKFMTYQDIMYLIKNDRLDILNLALNYKKNRQVLFNRFYLLNNDKPFNLFDLGNINKSFFLYSCECNNINICKFFLENTKNNIFYDQLENGIDISIMNNNKNIIEYILLNYIDKIQRNKYNKIEEYIKSSIFNIDIIYKLLKKENLDYNKINELFKNNNLKLNYLKL